MQHSPSTLTVVLLSKTLSTVSADPKPLLVWKITTTISSVIRMAGRLEDNLLVVLQGDTKCLEAAEPSDIFPLSLSNSVEVFD
jgi:hypothetical protein